MLGNTTEYTSDNITEVAVPNCSGLFDSIISAVLAFKHPDLMGLRIKDFKLKAHIYYDKDYVYIEIPSRLSTGISIRISELNGIAWPKEM